MHAWSYHVVVWIFELENQKVGLKYWKVLEGKTGWERVFMVIIKSRWGRGCTWL